MFNVINPYAFLSAYNIKHAAYFDGQTAYLSRTFGSPSNALKWTANFWMRRSESVPSGYTNIFASKTPSGWYYFDIMLNNDSITFQHGQSGVGATNMTEAGIRRDQTAFNCVTVAVDTTLADGASRVKLYVDGAQVALLGTPPTQGLSYNFNTAALHTIMAEYSSAATGFTDGSLAEFHFVDGQQLTPDEFGKRDWLTGNWVAKTYAGAYGSNGFYLDFSNAANLGEDRSGNGNDWTVNGAVTQVSSTPTNVYATLNPLIPHAMTYLNGNRKALASVATWTDVVSTFKIPTTGEYYWEAVVTKPGNGVLAIGILGEGHHVAAADAYWWSARTNYSPAYGYIDTGAKGSSSGSAVYGSAYSTGDVIGVHYDADSGTLTFYLNGVSQGVAFAGLEGSFHAAMSAYHQIGANGFEFRFEEQAWTHAAPAGAVSLCTDHLPTVSGKSLAEHFSTVLYTGNGTGQMIDSGLSQVDFTWIKSRSAARGHYLFDTLRGANTSLGSEGTSPEITQTSSLTAFAAGTFTLGTDAWVNANAESYVSWNFALPSSETNASGDLTATTKYNASLGMAVILAAMDGSSADRTIGLPVIDGKAPAMILAFNRDATFDRWVYHKDLGLAHELALNSSDPASSNGTFWGTPTSALMTVKASFTATTDTFMFICFWETDFVKIGAYVGNGDVDGPFINAMISPAFFLYKNASSAVTDWEVHDWARSPCNAVHNAIRPNQAAVEDAVTVVGDFTTVGFKTRNANADGNASGNTMCYLMIGQPTGGGHAAEATAR